jgi:protein HIRA/HIR1
MIQLLTNVPPGKHRDLQRVTVPYAKLLDMVDTTSEHGDAMDL